MIAGALTYLAVKINALLLDVWRRRQGQDEKFDHQLFAALRAVLNTFVIIVAALITAHGAVRRFFPYFPVVGDTIDERLIETLELAEIFCFLR